jgi:hydroxymethylpyrimidine pyrophosphatase-like HAD family hydrolase
VIRLIATDLDGTIVHHDGSISARTLRALEAASRAGIRVVFVTGRPPRWMGSVVEATGHRGVGICANGAYIYDLASEAVVQTFAMAVDSALAAVTLVRSELPTAAFAVEAVDGFGHEPHYVPRWNPEPLLGVGPIEEFLTTSIAKLLVRDDSLSGDVMLERTREVLGGVVEVTHSNTKDSLLELSALGVNKGSTLERLAASWGIDASEVVAFGDMPNDVPMLQWAGQGFAMGDSHPEALAVADRVIGTIAEDAVALTVEGLLGP